MYCMTQTIFILNGPNLNQLGQREPDIYGAATLSDIEDLCLSEGKRCAFEIDFRQSNHEGILIDWVQEASQNAAGLVLNLGALTHTSIALHDAVRAGSIPAIEVHISNIYKRESFRHHSYISAVSAGVICGLGPHGYQLAISALSKILNDAANP